MACPTCGDDEWEDHTDGRRYCAVCMWTDGIQPESGSMKAIICGIQGGLQVYTPGVEGQLGSLLGWHKCPCGRSAAKWLDPEAGRIAVAAQDRSMVRGLGLVNTVLLNAFGTRGQSWDLFKQWHAGATHLPGYVFDESRAGCWAVPFLIGSTTDSRWATEDEYYEEAFPT